MKAFLFPYYGLRRLIRYYSIPLSLSVALFFATKGNIVAANSPAPQGSAITSVLADLNGQVINALTGEPLGVVSIMIKGTSRGTTTDVNGRFTLSDVPDNAVLVVSSVGFASLEIPVSNMGTAVPSGPETSGYSSSAQGLLISLAPAGSSLEEVQVVGYGTSLRANVTQSISSIKGEALNERPTAMNVLQGLAGKVPGVNVMTNSGKPGGAPAIKIRGVGTISGSSEPLYVIDGIVGADPTMIDPAVIESMDILKDAAAAAIYGARGANGVVVITTQKGRAGVSEITFNNTVSYGTLQRQADLLDAEGALKMWEMKYNYPYRTNPEVPRYAPHLPQGQDFARKSELFNPDGSPKYNTNWLEESTRPALSTNHSITFSGGKDNLRVMANVSYRNQEGLLLNSYEKRLNAYFNINWDVKPWLTINGILNSGANQGNNVDLNPTGSTAIRKIYEFSPFFPIKYEDGTWARGGDYPGVDNSENPVRLLNEMKNTIGRTYSLANIGLTFHILPQLDLVTTVGAQTNARYDLYYAGRDLSGVSLNQEGISRRTHGNSGGYTNENYLSYKDDFGKHSVNAVAGASWYYTRSTLSQVQTQTFFDDFYSYNSSQAGSVLVPYDGGVNGTYSDPSGNQMNSFFGRVNYSYDGRYLLGASYRADGSSRFGANNKYGFFPSVSAGWNISNEAFFDELAGTINTLKLRVSYGAVGNAEIGDYRTTARLTNSLSTFNDQNTSVVVLSSIGNQNLEWESSEQTNIGLDISLLGGRLDITADWYNKVNTRLLYQRQLPVSTGFQTIWDNIGDIRNRGVEIGIYTINIRNQHFRWNTAFNFTRNVSKVIDLNGDILYPWIQRNMEGRPLNEFYGFVRERIWGTHEAAEAMAFDGSRPGDVKWQDTNGNGDKDPDDRVPLGNAMPKFEANMSNTFTYRGLALIIDLQSMYGLHLADLSKHLMQNSGTNTNSYKAILDAWTPDNQNTMVPALRNPALGDAGGASEPADSYAVEDGTFLRVRNIALSYGVTSDWLQRILIKKLTVVANVENAFLFTKYSGIDPEYTTFDAQLNQGVVFYQYPKPRTFSLSLNLTF